MPIPSPNLDDRSFDELVRSALAQIREKSPEWTDLSPGDPGTVLLEVFAYLTDQMLYRLNRIPEKAYHEFLRLIGVRLHPPSAATVTLRFRRSASGAAEIAIPEGTRVTTGRPAAGGEAPVFVTAQAASIAAGADTVDVLAINCEPVEGELVGTGTGRPGLSLSLARPPVIAPTRDGLDLIVGVEAQPDELGERAVARRFGDKAFRVWREVDHFADPGPDDLVYIADRLEGRITFAPAVRMTGATGELAAAPSALGAVPATGREIRAWYRRGGGAQGNLPAETLTTLKDAVPGVEVTNPEPATGGRAAETVDNALVRGPQEIHSLSRAVTARDYEFNATSVGAVARARAITRVALWSFAEPGTVEVTLVPDLPADQRPGGRVSSDALAAQQTEEARALVQARLDERRPLGTTCLVTWARYKPVKVQARLHVRREEDAAGVRARVLASLYDTINPLATGTNSGGWEFGQPLRVSDVYYTAQREPGVRWVDDVRLVVEDVPAAAVSGLVADPNQPGMWYATAGDALFTSRDDGRGWELSARFAGQRIGVVAPDAGTPGRVAVVTRPDDKTSQLHLSSDCAQTFAGPTRSFDFAVEDAAWTVRDRVQLLLLAGDSGLFELALAPDASPVQVLVDVDSASRPLYAVAAARVADMDCVAVAAQDMGGVFFSRTGGKTNTFRSIGLEKQDVRILEVQRDGPLAFLWAGITVESPTDPGRGCLFWQLGAVDPEGGWQERSKGFEAAGSCRGIAFGADAIFAATHHGGVVRLAGRQEDQAWQLPDVNSGLPLRDPGRFHPVDAIAAAGSTLMAGGVAGVVASHDGGVSYQLSSRREFTTDDVTIPPNWLLSSEEHDLEVVTDETASH